MKNILLPIGLLFSVLCNAQSLYLSTVDRGLYTFDVESCSLDFVCQSQFAFSDIALSLDGTLYAIRGNGALFEVNLANCFTTQIHSFNDQAFNSLTISQDGIVYATGNKGRLNSYNLNTGESIYHGDFGLPATGDLTFNEGELYAAVQSDRIIRIDINNPGSSQIAIDEEIEGEIWGIVSYAGGNCEDLTTYMVSDGVDDNNNFVGSSIYIVDFVSQSFTQTCTVGKQITGGASTDEFLASNPLTIIDINTVDPTCNEANGTLGIDVVGGLGDIAYSINGLPFKFDSLFLDIPAGTYEIVVRDDNNCFDTLSTDLTTMDGPQINILTPTPTTCGFQNGELSLTVNGGIPPYMYSIDNGMSFQSNPFFEGLPEGQYDVVVSDFIGCTDIVTQEITSLPPVEIINTNPAPETCYSGNASLNVETNIENVQYSFEGGDFQSENMYENLSAGEYRIKVRDENGCLDSTVVNIVEVIPDTIENINTVDASCGLPNGQVIISPSISTAAYAINNGSFGISNIFNSLLSDSYLLSMKDENGCLSESTIALDGTPMFSLSGAQTTITDCGGSTGTATLAEPSNGGPYSVYLDGDYIGNSLFVEGLTTGVHSVRVIDMNGCEDSLTVNIDQDKCLKGVPNVFSPNGDNNNDEFGIIVHPDFNGIITEFIVYDRYGNIAYSIGEPTSDPKTASWDGYINGQLATSGVYVYIVNLIDEKGTPEFVKGDILLVR